MGQAKQRGTYEQRLVAAQERYALAMIERKRVEAEREAEWCRLQAEAKEQAAKDREARRQERIAAGLDPELPVQSGHSAFGRRRAASALRAGVSTTSLAIALVAITLATPPIRSKQGGKQ